MQLFEGMKGYQESLSSAKKFVNTSEQFVAELVDIGERIKEILQDAASMEHAAPISFIAGLFLNKINAPSAIYEDIALTCLLHDIGLQDSPEAVRSADISQMNEQQLNFYYAHPKYGARVLVWEGFKPALVTAVAQHHMRYDDKGFPEIFLGDEISLIAELIGISEDFITVSKDKTIKDPVSEFKKKHLTKFSKKLQYVFNLTFPGLED
jgi:response regulator RpfG family c-di-GMP phosphodiesterase